MRNTDPAFVRDFADEKVEALVEMMFLAATADGEFSEEEREQFIKCAESLTSRVVTGDKLDNLILRSKTALEAVGREARLAAVKDRLPELESRKLALALAIQVTAVDGFIRTSERDLILQTAEALGIDGDTAANMVKDLASQ